MYSVEFSETALKQLSKIEEDIQDRILAVLERVTIRPFHFIKRKQGTSYFILRIGEHRAILDIKQEENKIIIMEIGHRKNIYDN